MNNLRRCAICLITGLVALLPVGGTAILIVVTDRSLAPLIPDAMYFPGVGILSVVLVVYLLGLTLTTVIGRWLWSLLDCGLSSLPGMGMLYRTLKQILGLDAGEGALFERVVLVPDQSTCSTEIGLVTTGDGEGAARQILVFVPGSPNP